jgi:CBS domain-containing protein
MTRDVVCVAPSLPRRSLARLLHERGLHGVAVVDGDHRLIGMVSDEDLQRRPDARTVSDLMTRKVLALPDWTPLAKAAAIMAFEGVYRIPVLSSDRTVLGLLSALDVLRWLAEREGYLLPHMPR